MMVFTKALAIGRIEWRTVVALLVSMVRTTGGSERSLLMNAPDVGYLTSSLLPMINNQRQELENKKRKRRNRVGASATLVLRQCKRGVGASANVNVGVCANVLGRVLINRAVPGKRRSYEKRMVV